MKNILIAIVALALCSCASSGPEMVKVYSAPFVEKDSEIAYANLMESTPFVFNGRTLMMISDRDKNVIHILEGQNLIHTESTPLNFAAAFVESGRVYIFGSVDDQIAMIQSPDLVTWTQPVVVKPRVPGQTLFNVSVAAVGSGGYVMAYETCEPNTACFNIRFAISPDLVTWTETGSFFSPEVYAACPTIREIAGTYYMLYLKDYHGHWATVVARSTDLVTWETSPTTVMSALNTDGETVNNSDVDLVEVNGQVFLAYAIGDQKTFTHIKHARYNGSLKEFFERFF